jgi:hypothetical protein
MHTLKAYEEVVDFIASGTSPDAVAAFKPSDTVRERVRELLYFEKTRGLTLEETSELDHYMQLEHLMRLAKARARKYVSGRQIH